MSEIKYKDFPFDECAREAQKLADSGKVRVHQKFTCEKCGSRQTMAEHNIFYSEGACEECGHVTNIRKRGCNYMTITEMR